MEIKRECEGIVLNYADEIIDCLFEDKDHMREWADELINAYTELVNQIYDDMQEKPE